MISVTAAPSAPRLINLPHPFTAPLLGAYGYTHCHSAALLILVTAVHTTGDLVAVAAAAPGSGE